MLRITASAVAIALFAAAPARAAPASGKSDVPGNVTLESGRPHADDLDKAVTFLQSGKPAEAEAIFSSIILDMEKAHDPKVPYRCAYADTAKATIADALGKLGNRRFILGSDVWCTALWGEGFALIDLNRSDEAGTYLARSVEMMPLNAHFINEYAEWYKSRQDWKKSYDLFLGAWHVVKHDEQGPDRRIAARSLRGLAYNLIELGDLDGAERLYRQSLDYEPEASDKVKQELDYIAEQRGKLKKAS